MRNQKNTYCLIYDEANKFYKATQQRDGTYLITKNSQPYPISFNPTNLLNVPLEFGTNEKYFSLNRSVVEPLKFIKDGAAILRHFYHLGKGTEAKLYLTVIDWDGAAVPGMYKMSYNGRFDLSKKDEDPKSGTFTVPTIDDSAWGILSQNDEVVYAIECNEKNPKAIRVLFDGTTLVNRYTYQTVQAPIVYNGDNPNSGSWTIPFVLVNQDGDSSGIAVKNQSLFFLDVMPPTNDSQGWFFESSYEIHDIVVEGSYMFQYNVEYTGDPVLLRNSTTLKLYSTAEPGFPNGRTYNLVSRSYLQGPFVNGRIYKFTFNQTGINLSPGGKLFLVISIGETYNSHSNIVVTPIVTNIVISTKTVPQPIIAYGLRPLDLLQQLVSKATNSRYSINSLFFVENNKDICLSGDSLRSVPNAKIYSSFSDHFKTFDPLYYMGLRTINGQLWMEKATEIYRRDSTIIDIGEVIDIKLQPADDYLVNEIEVGSPDIDLRHPSGRLEFNAPNTFSLEIFSSKKKMSIITKYRLGCFDIIFLILDYKGSSTKDNSGDKTVFTVKITDEQGMAAEDIETFENVTIDNAPLNPFIKLPLDNDVITFNKPVIRGIAKPGDTVNIYADTVLDGGTVADVNGDWFYNINTELDTFIDGVQTGIHVIDATFTDDAAPKDTISIQIDTSATTDQEISYPELNSNLYNNKPLIRGYAQKDQNIDISLDSVVIGSVVADASCRWSFQIVNPISNGAHVISINVGIDTVAFNVDSNVEFPLITYIGSELDGEVIINNLPLIKGVALPGTVVDLWLNYINFPGSKLGTAITDANGNWSYQVVPITYLDPTSGIPVIVAPIQNGLNIISTSLINHTVSIVVTGYKLSRPDYSSITGVTDNTVFNTEYSPQRMMENRYPLFASILAKQYPTSIKFQKPSKNGNLRTVLNGKIVSESADIKSSLLGTPIALLEWALIKTRTNKSFAKALEDFNKGGIVQMSFNGVLLYCLPIGSMKMNSLHSDVQEWKLLMSPQTTYQSLLNLYRNGLLITLNKNSMFHSDYNSLHFVKYNFELAENQNLKDIYDDWFSNRNDQWSENPLYVQKFNTTEVIRDQVITNGVSNPILRVYRCFDAFLIDAIPYFPVAPPPMFTPEIVMEAELNWSAYPPDQYFCVWFVGETPVGISERVETRASWPGTIKIVSNSSLNQVGFFYSTGIKTILRLEGFVDKAQTQVVTEVSTDQNGNTSLQYSMVVGVRDIRFGTAYGLPDYLYKKLTLAVVLDNLIIELIKYTLKEGEKIDPAEYYAGHPLFYYIAAFNFKENPLGLTVDTPDISGRQGVVLIVDGQAVGLPVGQVTRIELNDE